MGIYESATRFVVGMRRRNPLPLAPCTMSQPPGPPHTPQSVAASTIVPRPASSLATAEHVGGVGQNVIYIQATI